MIIFNYITWFRELSNVWSNEGHKLTAFLSVFYLPFLAFYIYQLMCKIFGVLKDSSTKIKERIKALSLEIVFVLIFLGYLFGIAGLGQLIVMPLVDTIIRALGIMIVNCGIFLYLLYLFFGRHDKRLFKKLFIDQVRFPQYTILLVLALGFSLMILQITGMFLFLFLLIPLMIFRVKEQDRYLLENDKDYYDYKLEVPPLFPDYKKVIRYIKRHKKS